MAGAKNPRRPLTCLLALRSTSGSTKRPPIYKLMLRESQGRAANFGVLSATPATASPTSVLGGPDSPACPSRTRPDHGCACTSLLAVITCAASPVAILHCRSPGFGCDPFHPVLPPADNDTYNRREYVVKVLLKVVNGLTKDDAVNVMQVNGLPSSQGGNGERIRGGLNFADAGQVTHSVIGQRHGTPRLLVPFSVIITSQLSGQLPNPPKKTRRASIPQWESRHLLLTHGWLSFATGGARDRCGHGTGLPAG